MPRSPRIPSMLSDLTEREARVLRALVASGEDPLTCFDLASHAPREIQHGRGEWAMPFLKRLAKFGFAAKSGKRVGNRSCWLATPAGRRLVAIQG